MPDEKVELEGVENVTFIEFEDEESIILELKDGYGFQSMEEMDEVRNELSDITGIPLRRIRFLEGVTTGVEG